MSDFVRKPLMQQLNKDNPITRIEKLESGDTVKTSAVINDISQLSSNLGEMTAGKINFYNPTTGQLVGYLTSTPDPAYPNYYMVALDSAGNVQFSVDPSTSGATTIGNGAVSITEGGVAIANGTASYIWKDVAGNSNTIYANATTDNLLDIKNGATGGDIVLRTTTTDGGIKQTIIMSDAATPYIQWYENPSLANQSKLEIFPGSAGLRVAFGTDHYIDALESSGGGSAKVYFNERNKDIDFQVEGLTNSSLFLVDAGLDAIGIGKAATSDNLMDVNGSINLVAGSSYKINGTSVLSATTATWTPTWTNLSVGNGTVTAKYQQIGNVVFYHLELVFGSTTSISGDVSFSPPVTQGTYGAISAPVGLVRLLSAASGYNGVCFATNTTTFRVLVYNTASTYSVNTALSSTIPGTWTTNDAIQVNGSYFA